MDRNSTYHYEVDIGAYIKDHEQKHLKVMDREELVDRGNTYLQESDKEFKEPVKEFKGADRHMEVVIQWNIPYKDIPVEGIAQSMHARQDLKGEPPDRHVEVFIQWGIPVMDSSVDGITQEHACNAGPERRAT